MLEGFVDLAVVILLAAFFGVIARLFKQPTILAYIAAGIVIGIFGFFNLKDQETFNLFSDLGIMLLLFLVGLEINYTQLRFVGKDALIIGIAQFAFTFIVGFSLATVFSYEMLAAFYIAMALTFSSTIIVVNLLSEKKDSNNLYGKLSIGLLLIQDFIAMIVLVVLAGTDSQIFSFGSGIASKIFGVAGTLVTGVVVFLLAVWLGRQVIPYIFEKIARSGELIFLCSLGWLFLLASVVSSLGLSIEIGGFLAGITLANSYENFQIANRIRPLRDFFLLIFFVLLGSSIVLSDFTGLGLQILAFSAFVLIGNPLIVLVLMGLLGYRKRTSFLTGITIAQISEFSFVLLALGAVLGHVTQSVVALITAIGIVTFIASTYLIMNAERIYLKLKKYLGIFEKKVTKKEHVFELTEKKPIIVVGFHRTGQSIVLGLPYYKDILVIDYDPDMIKVLTRHNVPHIFGDITDPEIMHMAHVLDAKLIISTSPDLDVNRMLITEILRERKRQKKRRRARIIVRARTEEEALILYKDGADYVLLPHFTAGKYLADMLKSDPKFTTLTQHKHTDLKNLRKLRGI